MTCELCCDETTHLAQEGQKLMELYICSQKQVRIGPWPRLYLYIKICLLLHRLQLLANNGRQIKRLDPNDVCVCVYIYDVRGPAQPLQMDSAHIR